MAARHTKKQTPLASVVILSYNGERYLNDCLASVIDQSLSREMYEIVVVDNASSDSSVDVIKGFGGDVKLFQFEKNEGFSRGNNKAIKNCLGEYLVLLNQDTVVHHEWLQKLIEAATEHPAYAALQSNILMPRNAEFRPTDRRQYPRKVYSYDLTRYGHVEQKVSQITGSVMKTKFVSGCSLLIRRSKVVEMGYLFDEVLGTYAEDLELSLRLAHRGEQLGTVAQSVVYHIGSFDFCLSRYSVWKNVVMIRNRMLAFWKNHSVSMFIRKVPWLLSSQPVKIYSRAKELNLRRAKAWGLVLICIPLVGAGVITAICVALRNWLGQGISGYKG